MALTIASCPFMLGLIRRRFVLGCDNLHEALGKLDHLLVQIVTESYALSMVQNDVYKK